MMRYVFVPVFTPPRDASWGHIALLAISPEAKTIELFDSDNARTATNIGEAQALVGKAMIWMSTFLDNPDDNSVPQFIPREWAWRDDRSQQQPEASSHCGVYTITQAQYLAFGYDRIQTQALSWPSSSARSLETVRRFRITADMTGWGLERPTRPDQGTHFRLLDQDREERLNHRVHHQYYPILDTPVVRIGKRKWHPYQSHPDFEKLLDPALRNRKAIYVGCRSKARLIEHCRRNQRFYPGFSVIHRANDLRAFREWVEMMDEQWRTCVFVPRPADPKNGSKYCWPLAWVDPTTDTTAVNCLHTNRTKLW